MIAPDEIPAWFAFSVAIFSTLAYIVLSLRATRVD